jgi:hypothetical protein
MMHGRGTWAAFTILGLGLSPGSGGAQQIPTFPTLPAGLPAGEGLTQACLDRVEGEVLCGRFRVPEDRETREGRTIDLAFVVLKALNDRGH